jgi:glycosyltransferase involved in cell wall biosynthesis
MMERMKRDTPSALIVESLRASPRSLRIAVVTETWPPEVNGVAMSMARIVEGLHARHHDVQLIRPRQGSGDGHDDRDSHEQVLTGSWPVPRYPHLRMGVPSKAALVQLWSLRRPDVVHIATEGPLGWSALQAARHIKLPVSSDFRTNFHAYGHHYGLGWLAKPILAYLRKFHNQADCTMVPTEALRKDLAARRFERLHVVGRGVDTDLFSPARRSAALRRQWDVRDDDAVALYVGRLAAEKNLATVLTAFESLRDAHGWIRLVLVGDGPIRAELEQRFPLAIFAGHRSGEDLAAHYASADLFLFPSQTETYGNVTTEAMASGLPVVAFDHAAAGQWIDSGRNGMLAADPRNEAFVAAASALGSDAARRAAMGAAARATALGMAWDGVVNRFEGVLLQAAEARRYDAPLLSRAASAA